MIDRASLRRRVYDALEDEEWPHPASVWINRGLVTVILFSVLMVVLDTVPELHQGWRRVLLAAELFCVALFTVEYLLRVWASVEDRAGRYEHPVRGRLRYMATPMALIDLLAILPTWLAFLLPGDFLLLRMLRLLRVLKITRHSPALATFEIVLVNERRSLIAAGTILAVALLLAAGVMHHLEGEAQPQAFGSIPAALWWAVITLTTVGYGDSVPVTTAGRIVGGITAVIGLGMFALPTAILGAGFAHELQKRSFAATAAMVARVPLFRHLPPPQLAELTALLQPRILPARYTVMRRGEHPDGVYFLDEGRVVLRQGERRIVLAPGSFFGEMALIEGRTRQMSATTLTSCRLLELRAGDFHRMMAGDPTLRQAVLHEVDRRSRTADGGADQDPPEPPATA